MANETTLLTTTTTTAQAEPQGTAPPGDACVLVIFGASGDLTKRLLMPAFFNLACDRLLNKRFAIIGMALDQMTTEEFRAKMTADIKQFSTRAKFDDNVWQDLVGRFHYTPGNFSDLGAFQRLGELINQVEKEQQTGGNILFYMAVPPKVFGLISDNLSKSGFKNRPKGWTRLIVEKPFGNDLASAIALNKEILVHWAEEQIYRIDHYLGKETVQNLLAFRFSNGIFEPLWNKTHVDHMQLSVTEVVDVEGRGGYYDKNGVLRDMMQNHMFQMLAYLCMEAPASFKADAIRNEKAKLLDSIRIYQPEEVAKNAVRGQYGAGKKANGQMAVDYRQEKDVDPYSRTETFAALKLRIDNWRWEGMPVYLRSGKGLWKRGTEIVVQFKKAPAVIFRDTPAGGRLESNRLIFHIQPDQGIELRFHAKTPGPQMNLQKVNMRFNYQEAFEASRGTGYEVLLYQAMIGDATLFSRTDLVESAWRVAQPVLDYWSQTPADGFPNYPAGSWGPKAAFDLIERDGRQWIEVINRAVFEKIPLFQGCDAIALANLAMMLQPVVVAPGDFIMRQGEVGTTMYIIARGQVEVVDASGKGMATLKEGDFFGELALLFSKPRTASIRAVTPCDLYVLEKADLERVGRDHPEFFQVLLDMAHKRYNVAVGK